jgi:hypothetical protein
MDKRLKNILVSLEVAKLAKEKGFSDFCIAYYSINSDSIAFNVNSDYDLLEGCDNPQDFIEIPTHHQLIDWLIGKKIEIWWESNQWNVIDCNNILEEIESHDNINAALIDGLCQLP